MTEREVRPSGEAWRLARALYPDLFYKRDHSDRPFHLRWDYLPGRDEPYEARRIAGEREDDERSVQD